MLPLDDEVIQPCRLKMFCKCHHCCDVKLSLVYQTMTIWTQQREVGTRIRIFDFSTSDVM